MSHVWCSVSGGVMYIEAAAIGYRRHDDPRLADGRGRAFWTGGSEAAEFFELSDGNGKGHPVVVDDFGNLVRVPS